MKINTKQILVDLKGKTLKDADTGLDFNLSDALSVILVNCTEGDKMKMYVLAQKIVTEDEIDVDDADLKLIKQAVASTHSFNNLVTGQILVILENLKK